MHLNDNEVLSQSWYSKRVCRRLAKIPAIFFLGVDSQEAKIVKKQKTKNKKKHSLSFVLISQDCFGYQDPHDSV